MLLAYIFQRTSAEPLELAHRIPEVRSNTWLRNTGLGLKLSLYAKINYWAKRSNPKIEVTIGPTSYFSLNSLLPVRLACEIHLLLLSTGSRLPAATNAEIFDPEIVKNSDEQKNLPSMTNYFVKYRFVSSLRLYKSNKKRSNVKEIRKNRSLINYKIKIREYSCKTRSTV